MKGGHAERKKEIKHEDEDDEENALLIEKTIVPDGQSLLPEKNLFE